MNAIQTHQMRRLEVERTIGHGKGLTVSAAFEWAHLARRVVIKAQAWMIVATEIDADGYDLAPLVDQLSTAIGDAETAYYNAVVADVRSMFASA